MHGARSIHTSCTAPSAAAQHPQRPQHSQRGVDQLFQPKDLAVSGILGAVVCRAGSPAAASRRGSGAVSWSQPRHGRLGRGGAGARTLRLARASRQLFPHNSKTRAGGSICLPNAPRPPAQARTCNPPASRQGTNDGCNQRLHLCRSPLTSERCPPAGPPLRTRSAAP